MKVPIIFRLPPNEILEENNFNKNGFKIILEEGKEYILRSKIDSNKALPHEGSFEFYFYKKSDEKKKGWWRQFIADYIGVPTREFSNFSEVPYFSTVIFNNISHDLDKEVFTGLSKFVKNGGTAFVIGNCYWLESVGINFIEKKYAEGVIKLKSNNILPLESISLFPYFGEVNIVDCNEEPLLKFDEYTKGEFIELGIDAGTTEKTIIDSGCFYVIRIGEGNLCYLSVDPISSLFQDTMSDKDKFFASRNMNGIILVMKLFFMLCSIGINKCIYNYDESPLIYSVDVEAAVKYYDAKKNVCRYCGGVDTKFENCAKKTSELLEKNSLVGSFFLDTAGVRDAQDIGVLMNIAKKHGVYVHQGKDGDHENWKKYLNDKNKIAEYIIDAKDFIEKKTGSRSDVIRYPSFERLEWTHDLVAESGFIADSSCYSIYPHQTIPFRMCHSKTGEMLNLWQIPCYEVFGLTCTQEKFSRIKIKGVNKIISEFRYYQYWKNFKRFIESSIKNNCVICICDHDISLGTDENYWHNLWKTNVKGVEKIMHFLKDETTKKQIKAVTFTDFLQQFIKIRQAKIHLERKICKSEIEYRLKAF